MVKSYSLFISYLILSDLKACKAKLIDTSVAALEMAVSVCQLVYDFAPKKKISQLLLDGLPLNVVQTSLVHR